LSVEGLEKSSRGSTGSAEKIYIVENIFIYESSCIFTISGSAILDDLTLSSLNNNSSFITIASGWNGNIGALNMHRNLIMSETISFWVGRTAVAAAPGYTLTNADLSKLPLGYFIGNNNNIQAISGNTDGTANYQLVLEGNVGVLRQQ